MDPTLNQYSGGHGRNGNQASACHQLIRGRKKMRVGEGERSSEERGQRDGGNHGYKARMEGG